MRTVKWTISWGCYRMERHKRSLLIDIVGGAATAVILFYFMSLGPNHTALLWIIPSTFFLMTLVTALSRFRKRTLGEK